MKIFSTTMNTILAIALVSSLALNVATVASSAVATALSTAFSAITGLSSVIGNRDIKAQKAKKAVGRITNKIARRTVVGTTRNLGAMVGEAVPYFGVAVITGTVAWDLKDACDTMTDMRELNSIINPGFNMDKKPDEVCGLEVPSVSEIWTDAKKLPKDIWIEIPDLIGPIDRLPGRFDDGAKRICEFFNILSCK